MKGEVVGITRERSCRVQLGNDILVVFQEPAAVPLALGDSLWFHDLKLDATVLVQNLSQRVEFEAYVASNNVHDLRLPSGHGTSRTPSIERLFGP